MRVRDKVIPNSIVSQWGDLSFTSEPIGNFIGNGNVTDSNKEFLKRFKNAIFNSNDDDSNN